ncbi:HNH endonuclease [Nocardia sp. NPDC057227]|uniref:HNH endonuclease n=1 Tax=Nocardia sp. NPDC057227 TaxID=3346056 RepID=UPI00362B80A7
MPWGTASRARTSTAAHKSQRLRILRRDRYRCRLQLPGRCIGKATTMDHAKPVHLGGTDDDANMQAACAPCHAKKSSDEGHAAQQAKRDRLKLPTSPHPGLRRT